MSLNWELQGSPSGFSLIVKNIDLLDNWEDDIEFCIEWERDLLELEKHVYKIEKAKTLPQNDLSVNFQDVQFPIDPKEKREQWDWDIKRNYKTHIDYMQTLDKDASEEDLKRKYTDNKKINQEFRAQAGFIEEPVIE